MDINANPFRPGAGTSPPTFSGREDLIREFEATLHRARALRPGQSLLPTGLRGVGKTTLLNRFSDDAERLGFKVGYMEAPEQGTLAELLAIKVRQILLDFDRSTVRGFSEAVTRALRVFKSFTLAITPEGAPSLTIDVEPLAGTADSGKLQNDLTDLLLSVGEAARDRSSGVLLAIDEIQYLKKPEFESLIMAIHRTTQRNLPIVLVGTGLPSLPALAGDAKSYAERLFTFPIIGSLSKVDARDALSKSVEPLGASFSKPALDDIVSTTQGYPFFLQTWGYYAWNEANGTQIGLRDVNAVRERVNRKLDESFFRVRLDRLTPRERAYLRAMADLGDDYQRTSAVAERFGSSIGSAGQVRQDLITKGMIYTPTYGTLAFTVPLFSDFLRRALPETPAVAHDASAPANTTRRHRPHR